MHPNAHVFGFRAYNKAAAPQQDGSDGLSLSPEKQEATKKLFAEALQRRKTEGRPLLSRWTAVDTNRAIRERVPGWTANRSIRNVLKTAGRGGDRAPRDKGGKGMKESMKDGGGKDDDPRKQPHEKPALFGGHEHKASNKHGGEEGPNKKKKGLFQGLKDRLTGAAAKEQTAIDDARKKADEFAADEEADQAADQEALKIVSQSIEALTKLAKSNGEKAGNMGEVLEGVIASKAALTEATGLLPKKHADYELFKRDMLPKMQIKSGDKRMPAEVFEQYDIDGDGVLSKDEFTKAKAKFRSHENRRR